MNSEQNWYVLFTRPNCEKKVAHLLSHRGVEAYCPLHQSVQKWQNKEVFTLKPLFTSWVFVHCDNSQLALLAKSKGVINIVYRLGQPAVVPQDQINTIKFVLSRFGQIQLLKTGFQSEQNELPQNNTLFFSLSSLGYSLAVPEEAENASLFSGGKAGAVATLKRPYSGVRFSNLFRQLPAFLTPRKTAI
jgi:hypothetical protein